MNLIRVAVALLASVPFVSAAGTLNIKPGLWETTMTTRSTATGTPMGPDAATLNSMPPEQRAKIEAMIKRATSGEPVVVTRQSCVTQEQVSKGLGILGNESPRCKAELLEQSPTDYRFRQRCADGRGTSNAEVRIHLDSTQSATVAVEGTNTSDGRTMTMSSKAVSKWIGSDCSSLQRK